MIGGKTLGGRQLMALAAIVGVTPATLTTRQVSDAVSRAGVEIAPPTTHQIVHSLASRRLIENRVGRPAGWSCTADGRNAVTETLDRITALSGLRPAPTRNH